MKHLAIICFLALGCAASTTSPGKGSQGGDGGDGGDGGSAAGGSGGRNMPGTGGRNMAGSGGSGMAGSGMAGSGGSGMAGAGGSTGGTAGTGATADAGAGDTGDATPADGGTPTGTARPSAGCGKANPPTGNLTLNGGQYIVALPTGYDPMKPWPLGFAFHGYGRTAVHCRDDDCPNFAEVMKDKAIAVFLKSIGPGWEDNLARNLPHFEAVLGAMKANYCVDERKVFISGTSSGAAFVNVVACKYGDQLAAVVPVAGPLYDMGCKGTPAALVVHGIRDGVGRGEAARNLYAKRNGCSMVTEPDLASARMKTSAGANVFTCVSYKDCQANPVRWCEHSIGGYNGTTHAWPPIASPEIWSFVQALK